MRLEVAGKRYTGFVAASAVIRLDALSNTFSFEATSSKGIPLPFTGGEACKVFVDGDQVLDGFIELVTVDGDDGNHTITLQGRDKTGDIVDSSIGTLSDITAPISLSTMAKRTLGHLGVTGVSVIDQVNPPLFRKAEDLSAPEPGQNAFEFLEKHARKRRVLLTSDADGNLVIARGQGSTVDAQVIHRVDGDGNNVLRYSASYDSTGRYNLYLSKSQQNLIPLNLAGVAGASSVVDQFAEDRNDLIRVGRQMVLVAESQFTDAENADRAAWEKNIREARGSVYAATVSGYRHQAGGLWGVNQLVQVVDEYAGLNAQMLINSVTFNFDENAGRSTVLSLVQRNSYTLELAEPQAQEKVGDGLFG